MMAPSDGSLVPFPTWAIIEFTIKDSSSPESGFFRLN